MSDEVDFSKWQPKGRADCKFYFYPGIMEAIMELDDGPDDLNETQRFLLELCEYVWDGRVVRDESKAVRIALKSARGGAKASWVTVLDNAEKGKKSGESRREKRNGEHGSNGVRTGVEPYKDTDKLSKDKLSVEGEDAPPAGAPARPAPKKRKGHPWKPVAQTPERMRELGYDA